MFSTQTIAQEQSKQQSNQQINEITLQLSLISHKIHAQKYIGKTLFYLIEWQNHPAPQLYTWQVAECFSLDKKLLERSHEKIKILIEELSNSQKIKKIRGLFEVVQTKNQVCWVIKSSPSSYKNYLVIYFSGQNLAERLLEKLKIKVLKFISTQRINDSFPQKLNLKKFLITIESTSSHKLKLTSYLYELDQNVVKILAQPYTIESSSHPLIPNHYSGNEFQNIPHKKHKTTVINHYIRDSQILYKVKSPINQCRYRISSYENLNKFSRQINYKTEIVNYLENVIIENSKQTKI